MTDLVLSFALSVGVTVCANAVCNVGLFSIELFVSAYVCKRKYTYQIVHLP